jgi:micrococcal nuclease
MAIGRIRACRRRPKPLVLGVYEYHAKVLAVVDGDTLHVLLDLGVEEGRKMTLRLYGLNAPEKSGATKDAGLAARDYVNVWLAKWAPDSTVLVRTIKDRTEKYGRYLADIYTLDGTQCLNRDLLTSGNAVSYLV